MINVYIFSGLIFFSNYSLAKEQVHKSWKTFQSDYGYEFKYLDCWEIRSNDIDGEGPLSHHAGIFAVESGDCVTPKKQKYIENGFAFGIWQGEFNPKGFQADIEATEKSSAHYLKSKKWLIFKRIKINKDTEVIAYVESFVDKVRNYIRWKFDVYCPSRRFIIGGFGLDNPDEETLSKIKQGSLSIPEPQKTIFESFRCIEPKIKKK